ncbi:MAG: DUF3105 domain-containing protein [Myxococcales bacterium]|nr:DUF3105 domain-containing protein [Myxococcales bacterium]
MQLPRIALLLCLPLLWACQRSLPGERGPRDLAVTQMTDATKCGPLVKAVPNEGGAHVDVGVGVNYKANPPASGPHWPEPKPPWAAYSTVVPREAWVHNLEHGGIVLLFNCGKGLDGGSGADGGAGDGGVGDGGAGDGGAEWPCPEVTDVLRQLRSERPLDKHGVVRILISADPLTPKRVSAVAWDWVYQSDTVDGAALRCFINARYGQGPEDFS